MAIPCIQPTSATSIFPVEVWRHIIGFATTTSSNSNPENSSSLTTKRSLALASYQLKEISAEFLYANIAITRPQHAHILAASPASLDAFAVHCKDLVIAPSFFDYPEDELEMTHEEFQALAQSFASTVCIILQACATKSQLRSLTVRVDKTSRRLASFAHWTAICAAIPECISSLEVNDGIHALSPSRIVRPNAVNDSSLKSKVLGIPTRLFACLKTLTVHSWPSMVLPITGYALPALESLTITHLSAQSLPLIYPDIQNTPNLSSLELPNNSFFAVQKPSLSHLSFGHATTPINVFNFASHLSRTAPNLQSLSFNHYGFDPREDLLPAKKWSPQDLPLSLRTVRIKTFHRWLPFELVQTLLRTPRFAETWGWTDEDALQWRALAAHVSEYREGVEVTLIVPKGTNIAWLRGEAINGLFGKNVKFEEVK